MRYNFSSLPELYNYAIKKFRKRPYSAILDGDQKYTFGELDEKCRQISRMLSNFGVGSYDKVALYSQSMPNWAVSFFAATAFGRIIVPMLPDMSANEVNNIITHSDSKAIFVSKKLFPRLTEEILSKVRIVLATDDFSILHLNDDAYTCDGTISCPLADDIAAVIYTSGTTGQPKGVMLSHRNICANIAESWFTHHIYPKDVFLSVLPMAHTYEMSIGMLYPFAMGSSIFYLQKPPTPSVLMAALKRIRPTTMLTVPLIIEKIYKGGILPKISKSKFLTYLQKNMPKTLDWLLGFKLRQIFGGRMRFFGIGGAKLDTSVEAFLRRAKFPYAIGYGLTETAPLICGAGPKVTHLGSCGKPSYGVQVRLENVDPETGEGELVAKGDNVMRGYYKDFSRTQSVLTSDGWFHTGDIATVDKKGRYYIKGRQGSMILGSSGENIYPEEIESVINDMEDVNESLVVKRDGHLVAMVHPKDDVLDWDLEGEDKFVEQLEALKKNVLNFVNPKVNKSSKIEEVEITKEPFAKTATMKIKRFLYNKK